MAATERHHDGVPGDPGGDSHAHPEPREYVKVAVILAVITALEVGLYYIKIPDGVLVGLLMAFSALKFALVALWFMHLRFDSPILKRLFITGIILAVTVYAIVTIVTLANRSSGTVVGG